MSLWDTITDLFHHESEHLESLLLPTDHVSPAPPDTSAIAAGEGYFRLWVEQMFLKMDRDWFKTYYPVVQALTTFRFGDPPSNLDIAQVAGPDRLRDIDASHLDRVISLQYALTPLVPFNGGTVQIEAGLIAMQADDMVKRFLSVVGDISGLLSVPQLSSALGIATTVAKSIDQFLGIGNSTMVLGYQQTFTSAGGGGSTDLRPLYIAIINAPESSYPADQLWVKDGNLLVGDQANPRPLTGVDYMLMRIETRRTRDDWKALDAINGPFTQAMDALDDTDDNGNPKVADADVFIRAAIVATRHSPDLTDTDRYQIMRAMRDLYDKHKQEVLAAGGGRGPVERGPERVSPTLEDVAALARNMDATPVDVGDLFAEG